MPGVVRKTVVGHLEVSTCWQERLFNVGREIETMVFDEVTGGTDVRKEFTRHHANFQEARNWHQHVVGSLQAEIAQLEAIPTGETGRKEEDG